MTSTCSSCGGSQLAVFYELPDVPAHSVLLMPTRDEAISYPRGDVKLAVCGDCGFIGNLAFDPTLLEYSSRYEETQGFSPTYVSFARRLAERLVNRYDLHEKDVIEIGCGKGEFLTSLCEIGGNRGVGFDPSYVDGRLNAAVNLPVTFVKDFYSEKYADYRADFVCCRMTLEHIQRTGEFVATLRRVIGDQTDTVVFFQVPDATRILREVAFWDVYYEHCSYFCAASLTRLFQACHFDVVDVWRDYGDQYLMLEARPARGSRAIQPDRSPDVAEILRDVEHFAERYPSKIETWKQRIRELKTAGARIAIWGSGSKAVAFLTTLGVRDEVEYVVDINPHRHGTYLAGTGHRIVPPAFLGDYRPDCVIVMNPIYGEEIQRSLADLGLRPEMIAV